MFAYVKDSLVNFVSGLGTGKDKSTHNQYGLNTLNFGQLELAYRGDWIAGKLVDIPAEDATREWRSWQADKNQISALEAEEQRLGLQEKTLHALIADRLYGGGGIVMGVDGAGDWHEPLDINRVKKGSLKYLHAVDRQEITAGQLSTDLLSPYYGLPEYYQVNSQTLGSVMIHPSRVVRFVTRKLPSRRLATDGWGDSILQRLDAAIKNAGLSSEGIATMINEASVDVIRIPDFMSNIGTAEYKGRLLERFALANTSKSMVNALILDKEEEWQRITQNFSGLPDMIRVYLMIAAGAGDVPATRFLSQSPNGMDATGDNDLRNYYDNVRSQQKNRIGPTLSTLDEVLIRSALGDRPQEVYYNWKPLWQPTQSEKADNLLKTSQALANIYNTGYVPDEVMSTAVQNMLIEDGSFPGIESAIDDYKANLTEIDETDPEVEAQFSNRNTENDTTTA